MNEATFKSYHQRYVKYVRVLAASRISSPSDRDDLESIVWLDVIRNFNRFDVPDPRGLLQQLVRWRARDLYRFHRSEHPTELQSEQLIALMEERQPESFSSENRLQLQQALHHESPEDRNILVGRYIEGKTWDELATQHGMHRNTVSRRATEILNRLRNYF